MRHDLVHVAQHASFIFAGDLVWWSALEPKRRQLHGELWKIGHILGARMIGMFLGMAFVLIREPVYTGVYGTGERRGVSALADQQTAGAMMVAVDILIMVFALASSSGRPRASTTATRRPSAPAPPLLDGELALHAALAVAGHGAEERVLAGLQVDLDGRGAAVLDDLALLVDPAALEGDVVVDGRLVDRVDRQRARRSPRRCRTRRPARRRARRGCRACRPRPSRRRRTSGSPASASRPVSSPGARRRRRRRRRRPRRPRRSRGSAGISSSGLPVAGSTCGIAVRLEDLLVHDALVGGAAEAVLLGLLPGLVEVRADDALRARARELWQRAHFSANSVLPLTRLSPSSLSSQPVSETIAHAASKHQPDPSSTHGAASYLLAGRRDAAPGGPRRRRAASGARQAVQAALGGGDHRARDAVPGVALARHADDRVARRARAGPAAPRATRRGPRRAG